MGPGRTTAFVRKVMEKTLLQTTLPVSWVGVNGKIESKGASSTTNTLPMVEALTRRWRNRIRPVVRNTAVAVQQQFQRIYCNPRGPIQPDRFDFEPAFEPGETLWTNHASFMRTGTKRSGEFAADINEAQASFVAGTIWDDESFYDPEAPPGEAVLKDGVRHPGWLHACITVEADAPAGTVTYTARLPTRPRLPLCRRRSLRKCRRRCKVSSSYKRTNGQRRIQGRAHVY